jgi:DNA-binding PadR family transcriptional regulator
MECHKKTGAGTHNGGDARVVAAECRTHNVRRDLARRVSQSANGQRLARLQDMLGLTPGNLIIQLRKLEEAGYLAGEKPRNGSASKTTVALTRKGRAALGAYAQAMRNLLGGLDTDARLAEAGSDHVAF